MIRVNLLPYDLRPIKRTPLPYIASSLILIAVIFVIASVWLRSHAMISQQEADLAVNQQKLDALQEVIDKYAELNKQKDMMAAKIAIIEEIVPEDRIIWSQALWYLSKLTPENIWYSGIREEERSVKVSTRDYDDTKKEWVTKTEPQRRRFFEITGYVTEGEDGGFDINPLTFKLADDTDFNKWFQLSKPRFVDTTKEGYRVRNFTLEYLITEGQSEAPE